MHGLKSLGSTSFLKKREKREDEQRVRVRRIFLKPASDCHRAPRGCEKKQPFGVLFCFHSQKVHVVIESQHCVHKSKRKTREKLAPQKIFQKIHIYIFFVKALRGERESNKMYRNKLAGHATKLWFTQSLNKSQISQFNTGEGAEQQTIHFSTWLIKCGKTLLTKRAQMEAK